MEAVLTPIDEFLRRQQSSTAVEVFSRIHDDPRELLDPADRWYRELLPLEAPGEGEQYAFRVDLDRCTGCKACVAACHSLNGLDEGESWRTAGHLIGSDPAAPMAQTVPGGCHHCVDPACLSGCPTKAYEKDPVTGIVSHLDDQCIGCSYCELTCPYEVPRFNARLGIVRKCDMCSGRLAEGEAPACVQGCPTQAISITVVDTAEARSAAAGATLVPGAPDSAISVPTTQYVSAEPLDDRLVAADAHAVHLGHSHPPLSFMLVMSQLSVGASLVATVAGAARGAVPVPAALVAAVIALVAVAGSILHLGRPAVAWRAVLGVGHSWLSREIVAFGVYAPASVATALLALARAPEAVTEAAAAGAALSGVVLVGTSSMIYAATRRTWWRLRFTAVKFVLSSLVTGPISVALVLAATGHPAATAVVPVCALTAAAAGVVKLAAEAAFLRAGRLGPSADLLRTTRLLTGPLALHTRWRFGLGTAAVGASTVLAATAPPTGTAPGPTLVLAGASLALALGGELLERWQFFVASAPPRMPGVYRP